MKSELLTVEAVLRRTTLKPCKQWALGIILMSFPEQCVGCGLETTFLTVHRDKAEARFVRQPHTLLKPAAGGIRTVPVALSITARTDGELIDRLPQFFKVGGRHH